MEPLAISSVVGALYQLYLLFISQLIPLAEVFLTTIFWLTLSMAPQPEPYGRSRAGEDVEGVSLDGQSSFQSRWLLVATAQAIETKQLPASDHVLP